MTGGKREEKYVELLIKRYIIFFLEDTWRFAKVRRKV